MNINKFKDTINTKLKKNKLTHQVDIIQIINQKIIF